MKKIYLLIAFICISFYTFAQQNISEARTMVGSAISVTGVVTNGSELGNIRYLQDETAGIAAYGTSVSTLKRGDKVKITGTLKSYNQLLEIDPVTSVEVVSSDNTFEAIEISIDQIGEAYEGRLVKISGAVFEKGGQTFANKATYNFSVGAKSNIIYTSSSALTNQVIPVGDVSLTALCSQFHYTSPAMGYQLLPRDMSDLVVQSAVGFTTTLKMSNIAKDGFKIEWTTDKDSDGKLYYGYTPDVELGFVASGTATTQHSATLTGLEAGRIIYVKGSVTRNSETVETVVKVFATQSNSTGKIDVFFNFDPDNSVSTGVNAKKTRLDNLLVEYIGKAKHSIDATIYNFNDDGIADITKAYNDAAARGVRVRFIACGTNSNFSYEDLSASVNKMKSPASSSRQGIMHNKFVIIDADASDPSDSYVWTGGTNWTQEQMIDDMNDVIIFQDQSMARGYQIEFEEMWGSNTAIPNPANAKFGNQKRDNTPHEFIIGNRRVECYFSPSDGVNGKLVDVINTANFDLSIQTMLITRTAMANAIIDRYNNDVSVNILTNEASGNDAAVNTTLSALSGHYVFDNVASGLMHTKFMVVDQSNATSDPILWTGSHNWSNAAETTNDENTVVVHDQVVANQYYQMFYKRFLQNNGSFVDVSSPPDASDEAVSTKKDTYIPIFILTNDTYQLPVSITISQPPANGTTVLNYNNTVTYSPNTNFVGSDSFKYKICYSAFPNLCDEATVSINVQQVTGIEQNLQPVVFEVYPNPAKNILNISVRGLQFASSKLEIINALGQTIGTYTVGIHQPESINIESLNAGVYLLKLSNGNEQLIRKIVVE